MSAARHNARVAARFGLGMLLMGCLMAACESQPVELGPGDIVPKDLHHWEPNANDLVLREVVDMTVDNSSIYQLMECANEGYYFRGIQNGEHLVGELAADGDRRWQRLLDHVGMGACVGPATSTRNKEVIVAAGYKDTDGDESFESAAVTSLDAGGNLLDVLLVSAENERFWFNDVLYDGTVGDSLQFIAVGGRVDAQGGQYPFAARFVLDSDGMLQPGPTTLFPGQPGRRFYDVRRDDSESQRAYYVTGYWNSGETLMGFVCRLGADLQIEWLKEVQVFDGLDLNLNWLGVTQDAVLVVGASDARLVDSGGYWSVGLAASLSKDGKINWLRTYELSKWSERFYEGQLYNGSLHAVGRFGAYVSNGSRYGYGLIARIDPATGDLEEYWSFGDRSWSSLCNTVQLHAGQADLAGAVMDEVGGSYWSWMIEVDVSASPAKSSVPRGVGIFADDAVAGHALQADDGGVQAATWRMR